MNLKIKNFQSHVDSELDIKPNAINVIVGESDSGKSSIIRALELLALNRPSGDKYRTHNSRRTEVEWKGVRRVKTASISEYEVDDVTYKALRTDVPRQVTEALKLSEMNFRSQHSPYHMLTETPGQRARAMNELADLGLIDYTAAAIKAIARDNRYQLDAKANEADSKQKQIEALEWVTVADVALAEIEYLEEEYAKINAEAIRLASVVDKLSVIEERLNSFPETAKDVDLINRLLNDLLKSQYADLESRVDKLIEYTEDLVLCPDPAVDIELINNIIFPEFEGIENACKQLQEIEAKQWPDTGWTKELEEVEEMIKRWKELEDNTYKMIALVEKLDGIAKAYSDKVLEEQEAVDKFNSALKEFGICPLCGSDCGGE